MIAAHAKRLLFIEVRNLLAEQLLELKEYLASSLSEDIHDLSISLDELSIYTTSTSVIRVLTFLRDDNHCLFKQLTDICGVDYPSENPRYEVVYHLLSLKHNCRIRVKLKTSDDRPVPSIMDIFPCAGWYEREIWDLYGVKFADHPDLRRILTDYGFNGHPFRKDFPLTGYVELRYDEEQKRVVYEPVSLQQDFRTFDYLSPWEENPILPGDEKAEETKEEETNV